MRPTRCDLPDTMAPYTRGEEVSCGTVVKTPYGDGRRVRDVGEATGSKRSRFGVNPGQVVQEFGYDEDVDADLRAELESVVGGELADELYDDVTDAAIVWWRDDDGDVQDLTDLVLDAMTTLEDGGLIWILVPKPGRVGHVSPAEVEEAADTAGLNTTSAISAATDWTGLRLVTRVRGR